MEALTLSSPMVVMVVGGPGAGKSFFAGAFANTFGAALVSRDKIRWTLFANHTYSDNENAMVDQVADLLTTELFRAGKTFILDGGYNTKITREEIAKRAKKHNFRVLTIVVQVDEPTAKHRAENRHENTPGDHYKQSLTAAQFAKQTKDYQAPEIDAGTVVISGKHNYATQARTVLKKMIESQNIAVPVPPTSSPRGNRGTFIQ